MRPQLNAGQPASVGAACVNQMKTFLTFICILLLVFSIGCSKQEATEPVAVPVEQPPAEPTAPVEPVAQEAQPVAPEQQPAAQPAPVPIVTGATALISNWSLEEQYVWESNQWVPGIVLDDGTATEIPPEPIIMEILGGVDSAWCPDVKQESGAEYITIVPGGCWKVTGNTMTEIDLPPEAGTGSMNWQIKDSKLEMDITFKDQSGTETNRNKAVLLALR
jgi:hypothetical protein